MAVSKIDKIKIIAHKNDKRKILEFLYDRGFMEIIKEGCRENGGSVYADKRDLGRLEYEFAKAKYAIEALKPFRLEKQSFLEKLNFEKPLLTEKQLNNLLNKFNYRVITELIASFGQDLNSLKSLVLRLREDINYLTLWLELDIPTTASGTAKTDVLFGTMSLKDHEEMSRDGMPGGLFLEPVSNDGVVCRLAAIVLKSEKKEILARLEKRSFKLVELPKFDTTVGKRIERLEHEIRTTSARIENLKARLREEAASYYDNLQIIADHLKWTLDKELVQENFSFTKNSFCIAGWLPASKSKELKEELDKISKNIEIEAASVDEEEEPPIVMSNPKFMKPFEFVTNIYGYPKYSEIDPTPFLAGFFVVFFGLCLTDAGYGITLFITTLLALRYLKVGKEFRKLLKVLFVGSIFTIAAGALTGGWFGVVLDDLDGRWSWLTAPLAAIRRIDPVKDPIFMLILSIILGYIHLLFGNAIDLWWKAKNGRLKEGLIDSGVWMFFLLAAGLWVASSAGVAPEGLSTAALYLFYFSIALIIFTQGKAKNFFVRIMGGFSQLYFGVSGYISDILSYSRLLALGLATGIIGMVVNIVGGMLNEMIPYVGWILMVVFLIGGHLLNLVISLVGAFIHSGRLQYVEFFKRFFDGGGRLFRPFARQSAYVDYEKEKN
jgi:V/A-type H+/Na+-transporting ATPase subunit I